MSESHFALTAGLALSWGALRRAHAEIEDLKGRLARLEK